MVPSEGAADEGAFRPLAVAGVPALPDAVDATLPRRPEGINT